MPFPYNNAIPQPTDIPAQSQPLMLQNFASIDLELAVDHVSFAGGPAGAHNKVSLVTQAIAPAVWPAGVNFGLYALAAGIFTHTPAGDKNITNLGIVVGPPSINYFYLPSGVLVKYGVAVTDANAYSEIDLNAGGAPAYTTFRIGLAMGQETGIGYVLCCQLAPTGPRPVLQWLLIRTHNDHGITVPRRLPLATFNWMTIGI